RDHRHRASEGPEGCPLDDRAGHGAGLGSDPASGGDLRWAGLCRPQSPTLASPMYPSASEAEVGPDAVGGHGRKIRFGNEAEGDHWRSNLESDEPFRQILGFPEVHSAVKRPNRRRVRTAVDEHLSDAGVRDEEEKALAD